MKKHVVISSRREEVKVLPLPKIVDYRAWLLYHYTEINKAVSGRDDILKYLMKIEDLSVSYDDLKPAKIFYDIETSLSSGLLAGVCGEVGKELVKAQELGISEGTLVGGRQLLRIVHNFFTHYEGSGVLYDFEDLQSVSLVSDKHLNKFEDDWSEVVTGMRVLPHDSVLLSLYLRQVRLSAIMSYDVAHFDRLEPGHPDKTYLFLRTSVQRAIARKRAVHIRRERAALFGHRHREHLDAPAAPANVQESDGSEDDSAEAKKKAKRHGKPPKSPTRAREEREAKEKENAKAGDEEGDWRAWVQCKDWANGKCQRQDCAFAHNSHARRQGGSRSPSVGNREGQKDGESTEACTSFVKTGNCTYGDKCKFEHSEKLRKKFLKKEKKSKKDAKGNAMVAHGIEPEDRQLRKINRERIKRGEEPNMCAR